MAHEWKQIYVALCMMLVSAMASSAQEWQLSPDAVWFKTLVNFDSSNGSLPMGQLVQGTDGNLYGTTSEGGTNGGGTLFRMTPSGSLTVLYNFCAQPNCADGMWPVGLVLGADGNLYGTTMGGGANNNGDCNYFVLSGCGTVFRVTPAGTRVLYSFCSQTDFPGNCLDGYLPNPLVLGSDGNLYGTTTQGGDANSPCFGGCGMAFKVSPQGVFTTLHSFSDADGTNTSAPLIQAGNGNFYGTASNGGANFDGTVFQMTAKGDLTTIYSFCSQANCTDGAVPTAGLIQAANGRLYGTTFNGGINCWNLCAGTVFEITPAGVLSTLYDFCSQTDCPDGHGPEAPLVQGTDGNFYGTTFGGGTITTCSTYLGPGCGTIFRITPTGALTTQHSFDGTDGALANGLIQATNGIFYGTTFSGANSACSGGCGTIFAFSVGLGPFVEPLPTFGKVGAYIRILGTNMTGTASVSFNGTAAVFKVVSPTQIVAQVPTDATSGFVTVTLPSQTLKSNTKFLVRP